MSSREDLEFLFEAVSDLLHGEARGGAGELRAAKFDELWMSYREVHNQLAVHDAKTFDFLAKELAHLKKRVEELDEEKFSREITQIEEQDPDDI